MANDIREFTREALSGLLVDIQSREWRRKYYRENDGCVVSHSTGTRDELSITLYLQSEINLCSVRMPVNA